MVSDARAEPAASAPDVAAVPPDAGPVAAALLEALAVEFAEASKPENEVVLRVEEAEEIDRDDAEGTRTYLLRLARDLPRYLQEGAAVRIRTGAAAADGVLRRIEFDEVVVDVSAPIDPNDSEIRITIADLVKALLDAVRANHASIEALAAEMRSPPVAAAVAAPVGPEIGDPALDAHQAAAVRACLERPLAFVWGPPGTGKTRTLGRLAVRLHRRGAKVLVVAPTHTAVDGAARSIRAALAEDEVATGRLLRFGPFEETGGLPDHDVRRIASRYRLEEARAARIEEARRRIEEIDRSLSAAASAPVVDAAASPGPASAPAATFAGPAAAPAAPPPGAKAAAALRREREKLSAALRGGRLSQRPEAERALFDEARIVCATTASAYYNKRLSAAAFDAVLLDEASMVGAAAALAVLARAPRRAVFGDFRQLPPIVLAERLPIPGRGEATVGDVLGRDAYDLAGVRAAVDEGDDDPRLSTLRAQYRAPAEIVEAYNEPFYRGRLETPPDALPAPLLDDARVVLVDTTPAAPLCTREAGWSASWTNEAHVEAALAILRRVLDAGAREVALLTPFALQANRLRRRLRRLRGKHRRLRAATIHRFQGQEAEVVVFDTTVSPAADGPGPRWPPDLYTADPNRARLLNVAVSRARAHLYLVANVAHLRTFARRPDALVWGVLDAARATLRWDGRRLK